MLVILEAVAGPVAGRRIEVRAGRILRIGRTARADYALGEDGYLSSLHFAVECDGEQCRVRDLGSSNGTFVNGNRVTEQVLQEGDTVSAGGSTFQVHVDTGPTPEPGATQTMLSTAPAPVMLGQTRIATSPSGVPLGVAAAPAWPGFSRAQANLLQSLYGPGQTVLGLLDASRDSRIPAFLDASGEGYIPIDPSGNIPIYVVAPGPQSRLLDVLIKDGWGRGWATYCTGDIGLEMAAAHLATFFTLYNVRGIPITFRFWDPKLIRAMVPLMSQEEAANFFGPLSRIIVEGDKPDTAIELSPGPRGPRSQPLILS